MILTYLYDLSELNKMGDAIVLTLKDYSFSYGKSFTKEEIIKIKENSDKPVYLSITSLFHEDELKDLKEILKDLLNLDGYIFQDLGLADFFKENGVIDKCIYAPETFITNHMDKYYFMESGLNKYMLSREITLDDIKEILKRKESTEYLYEPFGYSMMFYSYRPHYSNFVKHYQLDLNLKDRFDLMIKEENRDEYYKSIEDERGFRIYKDKILNAYEESLSLDADYFLLDRMFIDDDMYFDAVKLYKNELKLSDFYKKYDKRRFDKGYLYHEVGLLKGDK